MRVTIKNIADALGVSPNTVSRALRDMPDISEDTKRAVKNKARELNYTKNYQASALRTRSSHTVGIIIPDISNPIFAGIYKGVESVCRAFDYGMFLANTNESAAEERGIIERMISHRADGLIICPSMENDGVLRLLSGSSIPFVLVARKFGGGDFYSVTTDDRRGGYLACEHLLERGYDSFVYLSGPKHISSAAERKEGFLQCMADFGIDNSSLITAETEPTVSGAYLAAEKLYKSGVFERRRAVFAFNDVMAAGVLKLFGQKNISVPECAAVIGYDNIDLAELLVPSLTTVDINSRLLGERSMRVLLDIIDSRPPEQKSYRFDPAVIARRST